MIINNNNQLIIEGRVSTSSIDGQRESNVISPNALKNALKVLDSKGVFLPLLLEHGFTKIGTKKGGYVKVFFYTPEDFDWDSTERFEMEITAIIVIEDPFFIQKYHEGCNYLSLRWKNEFIEKRQNGQLISKEIILREVSLTSNPVNRDCKTKIIDQDKILDRFLENSIYLNGDKVKIKSFYQSGEDYFASVEFLDENVMIKSADDVWAGNLVDEKGNKIEGFLRKDNYSNMLNIYNELIESAKTNQPNFDYEGAKVELYSPNQGEIITKNNEEIKFNITESGAEFSMVETPESPSEEVIENETETTPEVEPETLPEVEPVATNSSEPVEAMPETTSTGTEATPEIIKEITENSKDLENSPEIVKEDLEDKVKSHRPNYGQYTNYILSKTTKL